MTHRTALLALFTLALAACGTQEGDACDSLRAEQVECFGGDALICVCAGSDCAWGDVGPEGDVDVGDSCYFECNAGSPQQVCPNGG